MLTVYLKSGWGNKRTTHSYEMPEAARDYEYFIVTFEARHYSDALSWKLRDESGCEQNLPYFFKKGDLRTINIIVYGSESSDYKFDCEMKCWPKILQMPIAKYFSITSIQLVYPEKYKETPFGQHRRKGEKKWTIGSIVTFGSIDDVMECQQYYRVKNPAIKNDIIIEGPIIEVKCMWQNFDIEKESTVDLEEMIVRKKFAISFDKNSILHTEYFTTMKMLEPIDHIDYNKEIIVTSTTKGIENQDFSFVPGARYEFEMNIERLNVKFSKIIQVPLMSVNQILWTTLFGDADHVTFLHRESEEKFHYTDWYAGEGYSYEDNIKEKHITLYKHGALHYKFTLEKHQAKVEVILTYGGTFSLFQPANDSVNVRIELMKLFKNKTEARPRTTIAVALPSEIYQSQAPSALQLPELVAMIVDYFGKSDRAMCRQVCRAWSQFVQPSTISGTVTESEVRLSGYYGEFSRT